MLFWQKSCSNVSNAAFRMTELSEKIDIKLKVKGGGSFGQAGAIRHGISRALILMMRAKTST